MRLYRPKPKPLLVLLVKRTVILLFGLCLVFGFLYGVGSAQGFMASSLLFLLRGASTIGILVAIAAAYGCALNIGAALRWRSPRYLLSLLFYLAPAAIGLAVAFSATMLMVALAGTGG